MAPAEQSQDRIYTRPPHFSVHLRSGRRLRWSGGARADYAALLLLGGEMRWRASASNPEAPDEAPTPDGESESGEVGEGGALLAAPGDDVSARSAGSAEYVLVQLSPVFVTDCAARAGLARADMVVTFRARSVRGDARLARLARDLAEELREEAAGQELVVGALVEQAQIGRASCRER